MSEDDKQDVFDFLDALRQTGQVNMFGSAPYVEQEFDVDHKEARQLVVKWMATYED